MALSGTAGRVRIHGPLEEYVPGFECVGVELHALTGVHVDAFIQERKGTHRALFTWRALRHLLAERRIRPATTGAYVSHGAPIPDHSCLEQSSCRRECRRCRAGIAGGG